MAASIVFYCLPLIQDYRAFQNASFEFENSFAHTYVDFYWATSQKYGYNVTNDVIDACWYQDYCSWYHLPHLSEGSVFEPRAPQSEIETAQITLTDLEEKRLVQTLGYNSTYAQQKAQENVQPCFSPLVLSMHKKILECNSVYMEYIRKFFGRENNDIESDQKTALDRFCKLHQGANCVDCIDYKKNNTDLTCHDRYWSYYNLSQYSEKAEGFLTNDAEEIQKAMVAVVTQIVIHSNGTLTTQEVMKCLDTFNVSFLDK